MIDAKATDSRAMERGAPRLVLLQVRSHPPAEKQEQRCFLESCGVRPEQLHFINLVEEPNIRPADVAGFEAVLIGGAGEHTVTKEYEFTGPLRDLVLDLIDEDRPLFGSCWGHHFIAWALGAEIVTDPAGAEIGTYEVRLTPAGRGDSLFGSLAPEFPVHLGHHDQVEDLPDALEELASSDRCRNQAIRVRGKRTYCTQFHSEMNHDQMLARLEMYQGAYLPGDDDLDRLEHRLRPAPIAERILPRFLDLIAAGGLGP